MVVFYRSSFNLFSLKIAKVEPFMDKISPKSFFLDNIFMHEMGVCWPGRSLQKKAFFKADEGLSIFEPLFRTEVAWLKSKGCEMSCGEITLFLSDLLPLVEKSDAKEELLQKATT